MPQAKITINSVIGSDTDLPINTIVQLDNDGIGGELTYSWSILDQPEGPVDSLSAPNVQNPTFTPKKQGSYLIRLIVNTGLANEQRDQVVAAVLEVKTLLRIPAAGETLEANTLRGWAQSTNELLIAYSDFLADGAVFVGVNASGSSMSRGTVVKAIASSVILSGLPQQQVVPGFGPALATLRANMDELLCVVEGGVDGATTVLAGKLFRARYLGRIGGLPLGSGSVGDTVYVTDTGQLSTTPGTVKRPIGSIMSAAGSNRDVFFDGVGGSEITPIDAPYVVYGNPGMLSNAFRVDGDNATPATGGAAWTFASGSNTTRSLVAKRFGASQTVKVFEVQREDDTIAFFSVGLDGTVEWQTDTADANGVTVGAMDWRDVNSVAADKRIAQITGKLSGATADNRGGEIDFAVKVNGSSGLTTLVQITPISAGALIATGLPSQIGLSGIGGSSGATGVQGQGGSGGGIGVVGIGNGNGNGVVGVSSGTTSGVFALANGNAPGVLGQTTGSTAPGVSGLGGTSGPGVLGTGGASGGDGVVGTASGGGANGVSGTANGVGAGVLGNSGGASGVAVKANATGGAVAFAGNGNVDLSAQSTPANSTGIAAGIYNKRTNCRAWGTFRTNGGGGVTVEGGQNIASAIISSMNLIVTFTDAFSAANSYASSFNKITGGGPEVPLISQSAGSVTVGFYSLAGTQLDLGSTVNDFGMTAFGD